MYDFLKIVFLLSLTVGPGVLRAAAKPIVLVPGDKTEALYAWRKAKCEILEDLSIHIELGNDRPMRGKLILSFENPDDLKVQFTDRRGKVWSIHPKFNPESSCTANIKEHYSEQENLEGLTLTLNCEYLYQQKGSFYRSFRITKDNPIECNFDH